MFSTVWPAQWLSVVQSEFLGTVVIQIMGLRMLGYSLLASVFFQGQRETGIFAGHGRQFTYFLCVSNTEYADVPSNIGWKGVWVPECYLLNEQSPMSVKAWVSLRLPVPHQLCSAPAALSLNVSLALLWHGVSQKCCAFNQSLQHGCASRTILATSRVFNSISRAQPAPSCSLSCMPFGLCPVTWYRYWCFPEIFMLGYAAGMHMTWSWNYRAMYDYHVIPDACIFLRWGPWSPASTLRIWMKGSFDCKYQGYLTARFSTIILGSVTTACFLQTYN